MVSTHDEAPSPPVEWALVRVSSSSFQHVFPPTPVVFSYYRYAVLSAMDAIPDPRVAAMSRELTRSLPLGIANGCVPDEHLSSTSVLK